MSKRFEAAGRLPYTAGYLLAARRPEVTRHAVQPLTWLDGNLVVCAGPRLDDVLLCLSGADGAKKWQIARIWEYERGFIGPSVWSHFISRRGEDRDEKKPPPKKEPDKLQSIVAGPIVVKAPAGAAGGFGAGRESCLFVAVAKGPMQWGTYLSECTIYELGTDGRSITMTSARMVLGGQHEVVDAGIVWACQGGGFLRLAASNGNDRIRMGPGGPDCLTTIDWYRQLPKSSPKAWLGSDPAGDPIAMGAGKAFRVRTGATSLVQPTRSSASRSR